MNESPNYELVGSPTQAELSQMVRDRIDQGWWPLGTPFVHGENYVQAMTCGTADHRSLHEAAEDD